MRLILTIAIICPRIVFGEMGDPSLHNIPCIDDITCDSIDAIDDTDDDLLDIESDAVLDDLRWELVRLDNVLSDIEETADAP